MEMNLMGQTVPAGYLRRQSRYNTKYRLFQNCVYSFLERPQGFLSVTYHISVFSLIFVCLLLSVISSAEIEFRENTGMDSATKAVNSSLNRTSSLNQILAKLTPSSNAVTSQTATQSQAPETQETDVEEKQGSYFSQEANAILHKLEIVLVVVFMLELMLRVWSAGCRSRFQTLYGRFRYIKQPFTCLDLFICVTSLIIIITGTENNKVFATSSLRGLRFLQILRIVRMDRRGGTWRLLGSVIHLHRQELVTTFYIGFLGLIFASLMVYHFENQSSAVHADGNKSHEFKTYADCLWWGIVTLTTVGYGDKVPTTNGGKLVASFFAIMGISFFALPAGILGSGFALKVQEQQRQKHFARRRHPAATLLQCVWKCYAAGEDSLSVATWTIHVVPLVHNSFNPSSTNPLSRKKTGTGALIERIPSIRNRPQNSSNKSSCPTPVVTKNNGYLANNTGTSPSSPKTSFGLKLTKNTSMESTATQLQSPSQLRPDYLFDDPNNSMRRKGSQLSLNFEAYFPGGFFSNPGSRKNSMNESENDQEETPKRLTKLRPKHKIAIRFIRKMKYFRARTKFKEALKPYDVKDVIEQYASGHVDLVTRVKDIQSKFLMIVGQKDKKKLDSSFSKLTVASRVVKIENQLTHLERKLDHLIQMYRKDKTKAYHNLHVQAAISSSEDESTPLSPKKLIPPSQLFVKSRQMDLLSPIISRSRSHSQPNALTDCYLRDPEPMNQSGSGLFQSSPAVSRQTSCFLNVPTVLDQQL